MQIKVLENQNNIYQKEKLLGQGAFGKAYLVRKKDTQQLLVIKQMNLQHMTKQQQVQTVKEAQILRSFNHPNIVTFKQVYMTKQMKLKIVMQYAENGDISKAIATMKKSKSYFDQNHILDWFTQICLALKHVHDRKILHRDIKGQNIFIGANNTLKLGDFGIARVLNKTLDKAKTVVGTPYYLSPQIIENKPYSFKSDIWSLGVVLYELCALTHPFTANSLQFLALKIVKGSYTPLQNNYSQQIKQLISQMLTVDSNKRPNVNDILKKPIIITRVKNFLSQTKRQIEFSHTVLHNQVRVLIYKKVEISNKLVQMQDKKINPIADKKTDQIQQQRKKLKEQEMRLQRAYKQKKQKQKIEKQKIDRQKAIRQKQYQEKVMKEKAQKQRQIQQLRRLQQIRRRQQQKKRKENYQKQKRQQWIRQYNQNKKQAQINEIRYKQEQLRQNQRQKIYQKQYQYEEMKRKQQYEKKILEKKKIKQEQNQQFNQLARQQYFQNQEIRRRAEERARRQRQGYEEDPSIISLPDQKQQYNDYQQKRPSSKGQYVRPQSRGKKTSIEKKPVNSNQYNSANNNKLKQKAPIVQLSQQQLHNAYLNPNFKKASSSKPVKPQIKQKSKKIQQKIDSIPNYHYKSESSKKLQDARQQMKRDRENFLKNKNQSNSPSVPETMETQQENFNIDRSYQDVCKAIETIKGAKWEKKSKSKDKKNIQSESPQQKESRIVKQFLNEQKNKLTNESPKYSNNQQKNINSKFKEILSNQNDIGIHESQNLFIQIKDQEQFDKYLNQLQVLIGNVNKKIQKIQMFSEMPVQQQIVFRQDDLEYSVTQQQAANMKSQTFMKFSEEQADFDYFSNYSKLQTLRITLQQAFGTDTFIQIYRVIQAQIANKGLQGFDIIEVVNKLSKYFEIDSNLIMMNISLLLTLVAMQDKMNYS